MKLCYIILILGMCCLSACGTNKVEKFLIVPEPQDLTLTTDTSITCTATVVVDKKAFI